MRSGPTFKAVFANGWYRKPVKGKKMPFCIIKHHIMKMYGGMEMAVCLHASLTSAVGGSER